MIVLHTNSDANTHCSVVSPSQWREKRNATANDTGTAHTNAIQYILPMLNCEYKNTTTATTHTIVTHMAAMSTLGMRYASCCFSPLLSAASARAAATPPSVSRSSTRRP